MSLDPRNLVDRQVMDPPEEDVVGAWHDVPDDNSSRSANSFTGIRKRRGRAHARSTSSRRPAKSRKPLVPEPVQYMPNTIFPFRYVMDVLVNAMNFLRYPFAMLLALWVLSVALNRAIFAIRTPFCRIPGISSLFLCDAIGPKVPLWADYPKLVDVQSTSFEQLLDESLGGSELSLEVKKAEMVTSDLVTLVKFSDLKSRDMMAQMLQDFVSDARFTGRGLQKLNSKIGGAVDRLGQISLLHTVKN